MANPIEEINKKVSNFVISTSRYSKSSPIYYGENKLLTFKTYKRKPQEFNPDDKWMEITPRHEFRPDLVSAEVYGTPDYWWKIMELNGMKDILEFRTGINIIISGNVMM